MGDPALVYGFFDKVLAAVHKIAENIEFADLRVINRYFRRWWASTFSNPSAALFKSSFLYTITQLRNDPMCQRVFIHFPERPLRAFGKTYRHQTHKTVVDDLVLKRQQNSFKLYRQFTLQGVRQRPADALYAVKPVFILIVAADYHGVFGLVIHQKEHALYVIIALGH